MSTFLIVEVKDREEVSKIVNVLLSNTNSRFTVTEDILDYAKSRSDIVKKEEASTSHAPAQSTTPVQPQPPQQAQQHQQQAQQHHPQHQQPQQHHPQHQQPQQQQMTLVVKPPVREPPVAEPNTVVSAIDAVVAAASSSGAVQPSVADRRPPENIEPPRPRTRVSTSVLARELLAKVAANIALAPDKKGQTRPIANVIPTTSAPAIFPANYSMPVRMQHVSVRRGHKRAFPTTEVIKVMSDPIVTEPGMNVVSTTSEVAEEPEDDPDIKPNLMALLNGTKSATPLKRVKKEGEEEEEDIDGADELGLMDPSEILRMYAQNEEFEDGAQLAHTPKRRRPNQSFQCKICKAFIKVRGYDYHKRSTHAIIHCNILRYQCPLSDCTFKNRHRSDICRHLRLSHNMDSNYIRIPECMTEEEGVLLRDTVLKCFPEMAPAINGPKSQMRMSDVQAAIEMNMEDNQEENKDEEDAKQENEMVEEGEKDGF